MPRNDNEIITQKWFLYQQGYSDGEMIGQFIEVYDYKTDCKVKKKITGLIGLNSWWENYKETSKEAYTISVKRKNNENLLCDIFIYISKPDRYLETTDNIKMELHNDNMEVEYNEALLYYNDVKDRNSEGCYTKKYLFIIVVIVCIIFMIFSLVNTLALCLYGWRKSISLYAKIGGKLERIRNSIM